MVVFGFLHTTFWSALPLDEGDRVVALMNYDAVANRRRSPSFQDFERWRDVLQSVEEVGAFRTIERSLVIGNGSAEPVPATVSIAKITASAFGLARVPPLLGRPLVEEDERKGAPPVVVIGHDVWRTRFASDPSVVGQRVRLGGTVHGVVGVMPEGFAFPVNHSFWTPLGAFPSDFTEGGASEVIVFARLAAGVTLEAAEAELETVGLLPSLTAPETLRQLLPRVVPYTLALVSPGESLERWIFWLALSLVTLLLVPPCANIAILVYARTVTRHEEFAARYALGASRGRIVVQLWVEGLVLAAGSASAALVLARLALGQVEMFQRSMDLGLPFWMDFSLSATTILYVAGLAVLAALIAGAIPALQATGHRMQSGFRGLGSRTGMRLGATCTALIVAQVAVSVAVLPSAFEWAWGALRPGILGPGFASEEFLTARLVIDQPALPSAEPDQSSFISRFGDLQAELVRQLEAEPGFSKVTVAAALPGREPLEPIGIGEFDGLSPPAGLASNRLSYFMAGSNRVDDVFFDVFEVPLLIGRGLEPGDRELGRRAVIVNRTLADDIADDGNPLGHRVRYVRTVAGPAWESELWYEIVGVVADLPANRGERKLYHAMVPGQMHSVSLVLRVGATPPADLTGRLQEITTALDPTLRMEQIRLLDEVYRVDQRGNSLFAYALAGMTLSVVLLSAAGMYALMTFTVNRRRREIGIRSALGAQPSRLLAGIFGRALVQVGVGAGVGLLVALVLRYYLPIEPMGGWKVPGVLPATAAFMIVIGLLSLAGPARRGLRIEPIEELRDG